MLRLPIFFSSRIIAIVLLLCLLLAGCAKQSETANSQQLPAVVAIVNDRPVPTKLYTMYLKNGQAALSLDPNSAEGRTKLEQLREGIVSELIDRALLVQEAERRGFIITPERMQEAERKTIAQFGGDQKYDEYLREHKLTRDEYHDVIRTEIYGAMMREELTKGMTATDDEIRTYYEAHKGDQEFQFPERVTASHILIEARPNLIAQAVGRERNLSGAALDGAVREEMEKRRNHAEELRRKASSGADFAALARASSDDSATKNQGGDLGSFARNSHPRAFDDAAFALKPGAVGDVVQTDFGFHVIKVFKHEMARAQTLEEATPEIRRRIVGEHEAALLSDTLKNLRRNARVRINEPFRFGALRSEFPQS
ncbi:MAG TPA: peptidylprolyl isomerase [Pyrinomonadaceae bacterium]|nr:peptidylprolyl isomerase [Pyrinomonadaceae bacterium]